MTENITDYADTIATLITLGLGIVLVYWRWQILVVDSTRQNLFEVRDELFDLALREKISFDQPAYRLFREMLNTSIRYADRFTGPWLFFLYMKRDLVSQERRGRSTSHVLELIKSVDNKKTRSKLHRLHKRMGLIMLWHILRRSPMSGILALAYLILMLVVGLSWTFFARIGESLFEVITDIILPDAETHVNRNGSVTLTEKH